MSEYYPFRNQLQLVLIEIWRVGGGGIFSIQSSSIKFIVIREAWLPSWPSQRLMFKTEVIFVIRWVAGEGGAHKLEGLKMAVYSSHC